MRNDFPQPASTVDIPNEDNAVDVPSGHSKTIERVIPSRAGNIKDGVFRLPGLTVGAALCWENIRYRTAKRLLAGNVQLLLSASAWPVIAKPGGGLPGIDDSELAEAERNWTRMIRKTPVSMARLLGTPVVHANLVGSIEGTSFPDGASKVLLHFLGESRIVDAHGTVLAEREGSSGEGIVAAEITPRRIKPSLELTDEFWIPRTRPLIEKWWYDATGRDYYLTTSIPQRRRLGTLE